MKLFRGESPEEMYLTRTQWKKVFVAVSIITILLYVVAMLFSLNGSDYFILKYQNESMNRIEDFMTERGIQSLISWAFATLEFTLIVSFIFRKRAKWYYILAYYIIPVGIALLHFNLPSIFYTALTIFFYILVIVVETLIVNKGWNWKFFGKAMLMLVISQVIAYTLQAMIYVIKAGYFTTENHRLTMSAHFVYAIEYDIALSVLLVTVALFIDKGKGDSKRWTIYHTQSGSSQTSKTNLPRLSPKKKRLNKRQKIKLFWLWIRLYIIQILGFTFIMILPFLMGKVFEFLVMYLTFAIIRYILGFKYSLHFKNEFVCLSVGAVVFGILTLAVPFFYITVIIAILLGSGLAVFLHLSYKYKGFWLFAQMTKPDKFAHFYVIFEGNLTKEYVLRTCKFRGLDEETSNIVWLYVAGYKLDYISHETNYSVKTLDRKLNDAILLLNI